MKPLANTSFKFHEPGLAPVYDVSGAFHVNLKHKPAYTRRFLKTFGFYDKLAAVQANTGWFHITASGLDAYKERYKWCGNYQEGFCVVRDKKDHYFHINTKGYPIYREKYEYAGDFKDQIAVVCNKDGMSTHINAKGEHIHNQWFQQLDIYHKGLARAYDNHGWFHVDTEGKAIYDHKFKNLEPFYNGIAHAQDHDGNILLIDEQGKIDKILYHNTINQNNILSSELVSFWKAEILRIAVKFNLLDLLPSNTTYISQKTSISSHKLKRVLRALEETNIIYKKYNTWHLSDKGKLLVPTNQSYMAAAAIMWPEVQKQWKELDTSLMVADSKYHPTFKELESDTQKVSIYQRAIDGYAKKDFSNIASSINWEEHSHVLGIGRAAITLLTTLLSAKKHLSGTILNYKYKINQFDVPRNLEGRLEVQLLEKEESWINLSPDAIILPRFLHYFTEKQVINLLSILKEILSKKGKIYILEMLLLENKPDGALLDINMLAESGGALRTLKEWKYIISAAKLKIRSVQTLLPHLQVITVESIA